MMVQKRVASLSTVCSVYIIQVTYLIHTLLAQEPLDFATDALKIKQESIVSKQRAILAQLNMRNAPVTSSS